MHLLVRDSATLDDQAQAVDLGQTPADLVFLSFSDADLAAFAAAWQRLPNRPTLRLASLAQLRHPMSVDLYVEQVIQGARCVVVRLLGGLDYWRYGVEELRHTCAAQGIAFVVVPGDGLEDARLAALSTVGDDAVARMDGFLRHGGQTNLDAALRLATALAGLAADDGATPRPVDPAGEHALGLPDKNPLAVIVFYRSHLLAQDIAPITALAQALADRGLGVRALYVSSLKDPSAAAFISERLRAWRPAVVLNATLFSAGRDGIGATLEDAGAPVLQTILAVGGEAAWQAGFRGLSQTDLAMQVVLPELDGRLLTTAISFKTTETEIPGLAFARSLNKPHPEGIALAADRAAGWARLSQTQAGERRVAIVLSDYPGAGGQTGHAVGLDSFASLSAILTLLRTAGYTTTPQTTAHLTEALCTEAPTPFLSLDIYRRLFATLPEATRITIESAWGAPDSDPTLTDGHFTLRHLRVGNILLAVQPDRGSRNGKKSGYHNADLPPRHAYVAFYLWLRLDWTAHALVHLGTHGTLEWLPGKSAALSAACHPIALLRGLPVIYPFVVNNPGEAAAAKRRLGAVTIGHMTPPMTRAGAAGLEGLDRLIDEYAAADGLDRRRGALLRRDILDRAQECGLLAESGADRADSEDDALARLDAYLCDVKDLQIRQGLHIFATPSRHRDTLLEAFARQTSNFDPARLDACAAAEAHALLAALDGQFVPPGPAGAPTRARADVLPTGRNLFTLDPRAIPTRSALELARATEAELLRRHLQDQGEPLRRLVLDLWGNTSLRTGGEDFALAFLLLGATPVWDAGSSRVSGFEITPLALLDRPRVDVTLRISGLCRDMFETQIALFDAAVRAVAARDEAADWNPLAGQTDTARIFGPAPGTYGTGIDLADPTTVAASYLAASATSYASADGNFPARIAAAQAFVHEQDHAETDLLDSTAYAAHEGGFAAAAASLGATPALYHADTSTPDTPHLRTLAEEIARVTRGRAANPAWIAGQIPHGHAGAAEIARALDSLHGFATTLPQRFDRQFDLIFDATLGTPEVNHFLAHANQDAHEAMHARFRDALARDLWRPQRNSVALALVTQS
jgi:cobaltochelatase CobN